MNPREMDDVKVALISPGAAGRIFHSPAKDPDTSRGLSSLIGSRQRAASSRRTSESRSQAIVPDDACREVSVSKSDAIGRTIRTFIPRGLISRLTPLLTEMWQVLDVAVVVGAFYTLLLAYDIAFSKRHQTLAIAAAMLMLLVYSWSDLFYRLRTRTLVQEAARLLEAWAKVLGLLLLFAYLTDTIHEFHRSLMLLWAVLAFVVQLLIHVVTRKSLHALRRRGYNIRRALVVGCGEPLERYLNFMRGNPWLGIKVEGYVAEPSWLANSVGQSVTRQSRAGPRATSLGAIGHSDARHTTGEALPHLGGLNTLGGLVDRLSINEIYVTLPLERSADAEAAMRALVNIPVNVNWIPDFSLAQALSTRTDKLGDQPLVLLSDSRIDRHGRLTKRLEDIVLSVMFLILFAPLILVIAWAVKASSPGPVLFKQQRHGLNGQPIVVWKFRTMRANAVAAIRRQATVDDERVTPVGAFLRRSSLDELPQLFNVLQGCMSLVGPRPHPLWLNDQFSAIVDAYMQRHRVKPGLTGWAQVHGYRGETDTREKMEQRVRHDLYYITHWTPWLDFVILARTIPAVLFGKNAY